MHSSPELPEMKRESAAPPFHVDSFQHCITLDQVLRESGGKGAGFEEQSWIMAHPDDPRCTQLHDGKFYFFPGTARECAHPTAFLVDYLYHGSEGFNTGTALSNYQQWYITSRAVMRGPKPRPQPLRR